VDVVRACAAGGADVIELGVPFSDPSADGPVIQRAMHRALGAGGSYVRTLEAVAAVRRTGVDVPIVLFGYYNPFYIRGLERAVTGAREAGADGMLIVDLPPEEGEELHGPLRAAGLGVVPLVAPTSTPARGSSGATSSRSSAAPTAPSSRRRTSAATSTTGTRGSNGSPWARS